jgi:anti-sigma regulatory factor (Ser/Thr protein kinase)
MATAIVAELRRQHAALHARLDACAAALEAVEVGDGDAAALTVAVQELAAALALHHGFEEAHLALVGLRRHLAREDAILAGLP